MTGSGDSTGMAEGCEGSVPQEQLGPRCPALRYTVLYAGRTMVPIHWQMSALLAELHFGTEKSFTD